LIQNHLSVVNIIRMTAEEFKNRMVPYARKLFPMMKRILGSEEETRDALQEVMLKLWDKRQYLRNCANPDGYVATAARNYCFDLKKKRKITVMGFDGNPVLQVAAPGVDPDARERLEHVHRIMQNLPENYREVLQLREIDGFSFEEIHAMTGFEIPYIRVLLSRSRMRLKEELDKVYNYERGTCQPA
jgi:RNA polymerase sigma-70 factor, ECF subfamily